MRERKATYPSGDGKQSTPKAPVPPGKKYAKKEKASHGKPNGGESPRSLYSSSSTILSSRFAMPIMSATASGR
jgi:hypothetical protein